MLLTTHFIAFPPSSCTHRFAKKRMYAAGLLSIDCRVNNQIIDLVDEWASYSNNSRAFSPEGADNLHRFDQSILNILLHARFAGLANVFDGREAFDQSEVWEKNTDTKRGNKRKRGGVEMACANRAKQRKPDELT